MNKDKITIIIPLQHGLERMQLLVEYILHRLKLKKANF